MSKRMSVQCPVVKVLKHENLISTEILETNGHRKVVSDFRHCVTHDHHVRTLPPTIVSRLTMPQQPVEIHQRFSRLELGNLTYC